MSKNRLIILKPLQKCYIKCKLLESILDIVFIKYIRQIYHDVVIPWKFAQMKSVINTKINVIPSPKTQKSIIKILILKLP